ncbi:MAG: MFS transporter [Sedimentisphaerales bacterium]|nr:MFS transporter [Sedimentisphaerales bacterium]
MQQTLTNIQKIQRLPWFYAQSVLNTIFCITLFGSLFTLFLDALDLDKTQIGCLNAIMPFAGILALFVAAWSERFGVKKTMIIFWFARKFVAALLLLTPLVIKWYGANAAFWWVGAIVLTFAICRAIAETAFSIWVKEFIPDSIRGKVVAINGIVAGIAAILMLALSSFVLDHYEHTGLARFIFLIAISVVAGLAGAACLIFLPGGKPVRKIENQLPYLRSIKLALQDQTFRLFVSGAALLSMAVTALPFTALYLKESIGLRPGLIVRLDIVATIGALVTSLLWGWAADRFGSKPVLLSSIGALLFVPILWFAIPRTGEHSIIFAYAIAGLAGMSITGWAIAGHRYLYVSAITPDSKIACMSVYYATAGIVGGISPLVVGWVIDTGRNLNVQWFCFTIDKYTPFWAIETLLLLGSLFVFGRLRTDDAISVRSFLSMFIQGNPIMAVTSVLKHRLAKDEHQRISSTQAMGQAKNYLSTKELLEAIEDPSFYVRYEAVIAIARSRPNPQLIDALLNILASDQPELSPAAAWALGKLRDTSAILPLRETLHSDYPLLRARSARSLALLGDNASENFFLQQLHSDSSNEVRLAYAAALGTIRSSEAVPNLLTFLHDAVEPSARNEVALSLARIVGQENRYIQLWRSLRDDFATAAGQAVLALKKPLANIARLDPTLPTAVSDCADAFAQEQTLLGMRKLADILAQMPQEYITPQASAILSDCQKQLRSAHKPRKEYLILALHTCRVCLYQPNQ